MKKWAWSPPHLWPRPVHWCAWRTWKGVGGRGNSAAVWRRRAGSAGSSHIRAHSSSLPAPPCPSRLAYVRRCIFCLERFYRCWRCCWWRKALVPRTGNFLSFVFSCIPLLVSFCIVDWRPFALSLLPLYIVLDTMRRSVMICYLLLFSVGIFDFVFGLHLSLLKVLWFVFGIVLCDVF